MFDDNACGVSGGMRPAAFRDPAASKTPTVKEGVVTMSGPPFLSTVRVADVPVGFWIASC